MPSFSENDLLLAERQAEQKPRRKYVETGEHGDKRSNSMRRCESIGLSPLSRK